MRQSESHYRCPMCGSYRFKKKRVFKLNKITDEGEIKYLIDPSSYNTQYVCAECGAEVKVKVSNV